MVLKVATKKKMRKIQQGVNIWLLILRLDLWLKVKYKYNKIKKFSKT